MSIRNNLKTHKSVSVSQSDTKHMTNFQTRGKFQLRVTQSRDHQSSNRIELAFWIFFILSSFGMVKGFFRSSHRRRKGKKMKQCNRQDDDMITANSTTKGYPHSQDEDLEVNIPREMEKEMALKTMNSDRVKKPIRTFSKRKSPELWLTELGQDWMSHLDDDLSLAFISIPGTHDSCSRYGGIYVATQTWCIAKQLQSGIRYLDIRCRREGNEFTIHHGPFYQHLKFDQVMDAAKTFLEESPSEAILMRVKEEYDRKDGSESFVAIWNRYMTHLGYRNIFAQLPWDGRTIPKLGQVRGKIVLLRDFKWDYPEIGLHYSRFGNDLMEVQDDYSLQVVNGISKKVKEVKSYIQKAKKQFCKDSCHDNNSSNGQQGKLVINHCSGTKPPIYTPSFVAKRTNQAAYDEIGFSSHSKYYTGIIVMDFPGEILINRIILSNITTASPIRAIINYS